ncbi:MAG: START domain-containing protein [Pseudoalteromonas sp.]|uniref:START domain-containing protein n=1 Tax=unclassified Pseudoalteromonas TaxID=194690 RepID=UPI003F956FA2
MRIVYLLILLIGFNCAAKEAPWQHWKSQDGVTVNYKKHANGIFEVQADMTVKAVMASDFMALLSDTSSAPQWLENVTQVDVIARPSRNEALVHTQFDPPWPVSNRDMVSHSCYKAISAKQTELIIQGRPDYIPRLEGFIRFEQLRASWLLTQINEQLSIEYTAFADPGGSLPYWISNKVGLKSALKTMQALRVQLINKDYTKAEQVSVVGQCSG